MKGVLFNLLEDVITRESGEDGWDLMLEETGLDGVYSSLGNYPDADFGKLALAASSLSSSLPIRSFGSSGSRRFLCWPPGTGVFIGQDRYGGSRPC